MACFTKIRQRNEANCEFEKYVTQSLSNQPEKINLNSIYTLYVCDKSENAWVCATWQWSALDWCYWIALPASPIVQSSNTVSCASLSFRTHPCVLAIKLLRICSWWDTMNYAHSLILLDNENLDMDIASFTPYMYTVLQIRINKCIIQCQ